MSGAASSQATGIDIGESLAAPVLHDIVPANAVLGGQLEEARRQTQPKPNAVIKPTTTMKVHTLTLVQTSSTFMALNACSMVGLGTRTKKDLNEQGCLVWHV